MLHSVCSHEAIILKTAIKFMNNSVATIQLHMYVRSCVFPWTNIHTTFQI